MEAGAAERAALVASHIPERARILDLGAGLMKVGLRMKLGAVYTPVDLVRYADATVLADLNDNQFPDGNWDCALALELLEHIHDVPALLSRIRAAAGTFICTYCGGDAQAGRRLFKRFFALRYRASARCRRLVGRDRGGPRGSYTVSVPVNLALCYDRNGGAPC